MFEVRFDAERHIAELGGGPLHDDSFAIFEPAAGRREAQAERIRLAVVVEVVVLNQQKAKLLQKTSVRGGIWRQAHLPAVFVERHNATRFAVDKRITRHSLREFAIKAD